ncbi:MAG: NADH-quinone oxidoreductase subunit J [Acidobacteriia bacterium]|nr:NADH-quinone oxidoreductase subunit J [Terriglobia bacterium]
MTTLIFLIFAGIAVFCGINLVVQTHPIASALSLIGVMGSLAILYLQLGGEFIAAAQVIVYAGAIMVLFVFVIMLLNAGAEGTSRQVSSFARYVGIVLLAAFLGLISFVIQAMLPKTEGVVFGAFQGGTALDVGRKLFTVYLLPFEVTSVLILIAIVGAMVLARKEI